MRKNQGHTLMELIVYAALTLVAGLLIWAFQSVVWSTQRATSATYLAGGQTETAIAWMRRDLNETALASIKVYPGAEHTEEAPGLSMASSRAYDPNLKAKLLVNRWGAPQWDKHVYYTLKTEGSEQTGSLVRWEQEFATKNYLPVSSNVLPSVASDGKKKILLRDVLAPNTTVDGVGLEGHITTDEFGGFRVQFLRRANGSGGAESLTTQNPKKGNPHDNTRMLEVELKILQDAHSKPHYYAIKYRIAARR